MPNPKVSVIMAVYNVEAFIDEAATSVLAQDHSNLELVISDDGSTDGTLALAEEIQRRDPRRGEGGDGGAQPGKGGAAPPAPSPPGGGGGAPRGGGRRKVAG